MDGATLRELALELLRNDTATSLEPWLELSGGAWALVDEFEHGGRRYYVALARPTESSDALSSEESALLRQRAEGVSVKALAIDSGVSEATNSRRVRRAMRKLGVESQAQLARMFAAAGR